MAEITSETLLEALKRVPYPGYTRDIVSFGIVKGAKFHEGIASVRLELTTDKPEILDGIKAAAERVLAAIPGVTRVFVETQTRAPSAPGAAQGGRDRGLLPEVSHTIAVASGKGGVGKSTVAVNLAVSLARRGRKVGLLDADIYGPSVPLMMGADGPPETTQDKKAVPFVRHGVKIMSIGFFLEKDAALVWRGPMVMKAVSQLLGDVAWGELDDLVVDLPPGTGDAQLTLSQAIKMEGAVIVATPQDVALIDAVKGVTMFRKVEVPILGIIENMSFFSCPKCGERSEIFSHGGARRESERLGVPFLGEISIDPQVRIGGDTGVPIVVSHPRSQIAEAFDRIAGGIIDQIEGNADGPERPA